VIDLLVTIIDFLIGFSLIITMLACVLFLPYLLLMLLPVFLVVIIVVTVGFMVSRFL
jgi:hypothetical protein